MAITPLQIDASTFITSAEPNAVTIGPQSLLLVFSRSYAAGEMFQIGVSIANARFAEVGGITFYGRDSSGALTALATSNCAGSVLITTIIFDGCTPPSGAPAAALISGIVYNGATQLQYSGHSIMMTASLTRMTPTFSLLENSSPTAVVTSVGTGATPPVVSGPGTSTSTSYALLSTTTGAGAGTVTRSVSGATFPSGTAVTLTATAAANAAFVEWGGSCTGSTPTCALTMTEDKLVTATFAPLIRIGAVLSSAQADPQSFLRFSNSGATGGTVTVTLSDSASGSALATWTSPRIEAGAVQQFAMPTIEAAASGFVKPRTYSVQITPRFPGAFQHVVWDAARGLLTNHSTCNTGMGTLGRRVTHIHSSAIGDAGYAASIVVYNTETSAASTVLSVTNGATGAPVGSYTTAQIAANGQTQVTVKQIESSLGLTAATVAATPYYVISASGSFGGHLQSLVANERAGVTTDLTAVCAMAAAGP